MLACNVCGATIEGEVESASIRSNVRKFAGEQFVVWRCPQCKSIHARDDVDLAHYYADYPFHKLRDADQGWMLDVMYGHLLSRLRAAGFDRGRSLLDYGCGSGMFLEYLRGRGYEDLSGYDEYSEHYADRAAIERTYDCVMTQDVIEHVPEPRALVQTLDALTKPGGMIVIGTPNAENIDLAEPEKRVHALHQPYHRHILSKSALVKVGEELGWEVLRYYPTMYTNTAFPFVNSAFLLHYFSCFDNCVDLSLEPIKVGSLKLWTPVTLLHGLFGALWAPESDVMAVFRKPDTPQ